MVERNSKELRASEKAIDDDIRLKQDLVDQANSAEKQVSAHLERMQGKYTEEEYKQRIEKSRGKLKLGDPARALFHLLDDTDGVPGSSTHPQTERLRTEVQRLTEEMQKIAMKNAVDIKASDIELQSHQRAHEATKLTLEETLSKLGDVQAELQKAKDSVKDRDEKLRLAEAAMGEEKSKYAQVYRQLCSLQDDHDQVTKEKADLQNEVNATGMACTQDARGLLELHEMISEHDHRVTDLHSQLKERKGCIESREKELDEVVAVSINPITSRDTRIFSNPMVVDMFQSLVGLEVHAGLSRNVTRWRGYLLMLLVCQVSIACLD